MLDTIPLQAANGQRLPHLSPLAERSAGLVAETADQGRKRHGTVEDASRVAQLAPGHGGHETAHVDMDGTGCSAEGLVLLDAAGLEFSELELIHERLKRKGGEMEGGGRECSSLPPPLLHYEETDTRIRSTA